MALILTLPLNEFQNKKTKVLLSLNKVIGLNPFVWNILKKNYSKTIIKSLPKDIKQIEGSYETISLYNYKNQNSDLTNVTPVALKILLDVLQDLDIVQEDNVQYHKKNSDIVGEKVSEPHLIVTIRKIEEE